MGLVLEADVLCAFKHAYTCVRYAFRHETPFLVTCKPNVSSTTQNSLRLFTRFQELYRPTQSAIQSMEGMLNYFVPEDGDTSDHLNVVPLPRVDQLQLQHVKSVGVTAVPYGL